VNSDTTGRADDEHRIGVVDLGPTTDVQRRREPVCGDRAVDEARPVRERERVRGGDNCSLGVRAVSSGPVPAVEIRTLVRCAAPTRVTLAAREIEVRQHAIARHDSRHVVADVVDDARELVTRHPRRECRIVLEAALNRILDRSRDAAGADVDTHFVRFGLRIGNRVDR